MWSQDRIHLRGFGARLRLFASASPGDPHPAPGAGSTPPPGGSHVRLPCDVPADRGRATATPRPRARDARRPTAPRRESRDTMPPAAARPRIHLVAWSRTLAPWRTQFLFVWGETGSRRGRGARACSAFGVPRGLAGGAAVGAASHTCRSTRSHTVTRRRYLF